VNTVAMRPYGYGFPGELTRGKSGTRYDPDGT
jgi:hypothetical protein